MADLSKRKLEILQVIRDHRARFNYSPTMREIAAKIGVSAAEVHRHCKSMVRDALVTDNPGKRRTLKLTARADGVLADLVDPMPFDATGYDLLGECLRVVGELSQSVAYNALGFSNSLPNRIKAYLQRKQSPGTVPSDNAAKAAHPNNGGPNNE